MGLEDHEWWREERRQQGHNASWDNFRAKPENDPSTPDASVLRIQRPAKLRATPSYLHLHAQQLLDAREGSSTSRLLLILGVVACGSMVAVGYFVF
ncbi:MULTISPECIES: hypothetical protein [Pseudomonas]|nr:MULTISPECIES: hypothetical protein [Pseudomonas]KIP90434.1 hypothetical protein RU08_23035 [Pseudomonas fulva]